MAYHVVIERTAAEGLLRIARGDRASARRIDSAINALAEDPRPPRVTKLAGVDAMRLRVGDYRVVSVIDDGVQVVAVTRVAHRREVYDR